MSLSPQQLRALGSAQRLWWVCAYGHHATFSIRTKKWTMEPNPWSGNARVWDLLQITTFPTLPGACVSASFRRMWHPFRHEHARVVLVFRTRNDISKLTELRLYNQGEIT